MNVLFFVALLFTGVVNGEEPLAQTSNGPYKGAYLPEFDQDAFLGIPYAQPPVGELRFEPAKEVSETWGEVRNATVYQNSCYWTGNGFDNEGLNVSEDCLTLNIVRPAGYAHTKLPVGVWIHGGGFNWGASQRDVYNLSYPVEQSVKGGTPIVAVSVNYRLSGWGFLASKDIVKNKKANNGILDQRLALKWVERNIEAFGGDPNQVTIWGESAGGMSVALHITGYGGEDAETLFHRGIMESGAVETNSFNSMDDFEANYDNVTKQVGCNDADDTLACLKKVPAGQLNDIFNQSSLKYAPVLDGELIPDYPNNLMDQGKFAKIPVIVGANMDEGTSFGLGNVNTTDEVVQGLQMVYPNIVNSTAKRLLEYYPNDPSQGCPFGTGDAYSNETWGLQYKRANAILGDIKMIGPRRRMAKDMSKFGLPVYSYNWNQSDYSFDGTKPPIATHFHEVVYVFHNPNWNNQSHADIIGPDPDGSKMQLADLTSRFFMSFIATGDPNNAQVDTDHPYWPRYLESQQNMYFEAKNTHVEDDNYRATPIHFINYEVDNQITSI
ncbi:hypothetical protein TRICI_006414 [Trichomonascus ciferrii]|uniref:Carboxylic ester hydrolase n=1 Tax=Trichomonascus ciferrii TaxID=44093 RepID=A0A642UHE1_9ASCO|nr:hypothetical protein TRICI_006414 [Trichomonascus ciferrii]